jgi:hypothetical protein
VGSGRSGIKINDIHDHGVQRPVIYLLADAKLRAILSP